MVPIVNIKRRKLDELNNTKKKKSHDTHSQQMTNYTI